MNIPYRREVRAERACWRVEKLQHTDQNTDARMLEITMNKLKLDKERREVFDTTRERFVDWLKAEFILWEWGPDGKTAVIYSAADPETKMYIQLGRKNWLEIEGYVIATRDILIKLGIDPNEWPIAPGRGKFFMLGVVIRFEVLQISESRTQVTMGYADYKEFAELTKRAESLWEKIAEVFGEVKAKPEELPPIYANELEQVKALSKKGRTVTQMAQEIGISESSVKRYRKEAGTQRRKK